MQITNQLHKIRNTVSQISRQVLIILLAFVIIGIILAATDYDVKTVFIDLFNGVINDPGGAIRWSIPLVLCGLSVALGFRSGVFNIGADGQLYLGAASATAVALYVAKDMPPFPGILLCFIGGAIAGGLWALIPALLYVKWRTNEVVTTLLLNFVAVLFTDFLVMGPMIGTGATGTTYSTDNIAEQLRLGIVVSSSKANTGVFIAIALILVFTFIMYRTTYGYELKVVGSNPLFARYGGIPSNKVVLITFLLSGCIAGLAGAIEILGVHYRFPGRFNNGLGFDGVVVALLANNNPLGILVSAPFFGALRNAAMTLERLTDVPRAMVEILQAVIVLLVTVKYTFSFMKKKRQLQLVEPDSAQQDAEPKNTGD